MDTGSFCRPGVPERITQGKSLAYRPAQLPPIFATASIRDVSGVQSTIDFYNADQNETSASLLLIPRPNHKTSWTHHLTWLQYLAPS